jgi:hypothetical protein
MWGWQDCLARTRVAMETYSCLEGSGFINTIEIAGVDMFLGKHHQLFTCCDYGMSTRFYARLSIIRLVEGRWEVGQLASVQSVLPKCQLLI